MLASGYPLLVTIRYLASRPGSMFQTEISREQIATYMRTGWRIVEQEYVAQDEGREEESSAKKPERKVKLRAPRNSRR